MLICPSRICTPGSRAIASSTPIVARRAMSSSVATATEIGASPASWVSRLAVTTRGATTMADPVSAIVTGGPRPVSAGTTTSAGSNPTAATRSVSSVAGASANANLPSPPAVVRRVVPTISTKASATPVPSAARTTNPSTRRWFGRWARAGAHRVAASRAVSRTAGAVRMSRGLQPADPSRMPLTGAKQSGRSR